MRKTASNPETMPAPIGLYSNVVTVELGGSTLIQLSGQISLDEDGLIVGRNDIALQTQRVFELVRRALAAHGATFDDVVTIRTYLTDINQLGEYAAVRRQFITGDPPTTTTVEVSGLARPEALVEVEVLAVV